MAADYEESWDEFLDAYQSIKTECDQLRLLLCEMIEDLETPADKVAYKKAYEEITHGAS